MSHHNDTSVNALWRAFKTSAAEPLASKLGEKLGGYFLGHPSITKLLDGVSSDWRGLLATAVKAGGGVAEIPGKGPIIYILNEALDAFVVGLGRSIQDLDTKSPDEIANNMFAIKAIEDAVSRLETVLDSEVVSKDKWFHMAGCLEAKGGKKSSMRDAAKHGYLPMNCHCLGEVFHVPSEPDQEHIATPVAEVLTIIELMDVIEAEAVDTEDAILLGQITRFNSAFFTLSSELQLKFEYLAKEKRPLKKLKLLIGQHEENWEATIDAMLDDPIKAKTDGVIKTIAGGFGKIGERLSKKLDAEGVEADNLLDGVGAAIRRNTNKVRIRGAENMRERAFKKKFRKDESSKMGWFSYLTYGGIFISLASLAYYITTH